MARNRANDMVSHLRSAAAAPPRVAAVILSFNARETLPEVVRTVRDQSLPVARTIVVDNDSRDGSREFLRANLPESDLLLLPTNTGVGSGHFSGWVKAMADQDLDFIWALEHDTRPEEDCLEHLIDAYLTAPPELRVGAIAVRQHFLPSAERRRTRIAHHVQGHRRQRHRRLTTAGRPHVTSKFSFNATLFPVAAIRDLGPLRTDFFFSKEDHEYGLRMQRAGYSLLRHPKARVSHLRPSTLGLPTIRRSYYSTRNELFLAARVAYNPLRAAGVLLRLVPSSVEILLRGDERWRRIKAKYVAVFDAIRGSLGPKHYRFLEDGT